MFSGVFPGSGQSKPRALGKKLWIAIWYVLTGRATNKNAVPEMVAFTLMVWSRKLSDQRRGGLTGRQLIRYHLMRLKLEYDLPYLITGKGTKRAIASPEEMLALKPKLASTG